MDKGQDILGRINEQYKTMSKSHKAIAAFIQDHYEQAVFMTAEKWGRYWASANPPWFVLPPV